MKRGTPDHPKTIKLASALNIPVAHAVGLLECLWHWTGKYARRGDIGRWPDEAISDGAKWNGDPATFVNSLIATGWVDEDKNCRYIVHDWCDHADNTVRTALKRAGEDFFPFTPIKTACAKTKANTKAIAKALTAQSACVDQHRHSNVSTVSRQTVEEIYQAYPRKVGKQSAIKAIEKACRANTPEWLLDRVRKFAASPAGNAGTFTPHPSTWFNDGRYEDEDSEWDRTATKPNGKLTTNLDDIDFSNLPGGLEDKR